MEHDDVGNEQTVRNYTENSGSGKAELPLANQTGSLFKTMASLF